MGKSHRTREAITNAKSAKIRKSSKILIFEP